MDTPDTVSVVVDRQRSGEGDGAAITSTLHAGRNTSTGYSRARTGERTVEVTTTVELRADERIVRVVTRFVNPSRDHRLRVHLPLPEPARALGGRVRLRRGAAGADRRRTARRVRTPDIPVAAVRLGRRAHGGPRGPARIRARRHRRRRRQARTLALTLLRSTGMLSRLGMAYRPLPAGPLTPVDGLQLQGRPIEARYALCVGCDDPYAMADDAFLRARARPRPGGRRTARVGERSRDRGGRGVRRAPPGRDCSRCGCSIRATSRRRSGWGAGQAGWSTSGAGLWRPSTGRSSCGPFGIATFRWRRRADVSAVDGRTDDRSRALPDRRRSPRSRRSSSSWRTSDSRSQRLEPVGRGSGAPTPDGEGPRAGRGPRSFTSRGRSDLKANSSGAGTAPIDLAEQSRVELVGDEDAARRGDAGGPAGEIDDRSVEIAVLDEDGSDGQGHPDVGQKLVVGISLGQRQSRCGRRRWRCRSRTSLRRRSSSPPGRPSPVTVSWATSSKRLTRAASSSSDNCWLSMVKPTMSAKPTQRSGRAPGSWRLRSSMARRTDAWTCRRQANSRRRVMAGSERSANRTKRSAASTLEPGTGSRRPQHPAHGRCHLGLGDAGHGGTDDAGQLQ